VVKLPPILILGLLLTSSFGAHADDDENDADANFWTPPRSQERTVQGKKTPGDLVNFYIHGYKDDVEKAAKKAGWTTASQGSVAKDALYAADIMWRAVGHFLHFGRKKKCPYNVYKWMPASNQKYDDEKQVFIFQQGNEHLAGRHHFRVFSTGQFDENGLPVWAVSATEDVGAKIDLRDPQQGLFTHTVTNNTDIERDYVFKSLQNAGVVDPSYQKMTLGLPEPMKHSNLYSEDHGVYDLTLNRDVTKSEPSEDFSL
jgi:hypothetical protein